jgi:hypothetical protein
MKNRKNYLTCDEDKAKLKFIKGNISDVCCHECCLAFFVPFPRTMKLMDLSII